MTVGAAPTEADLQAYVDGWLSPARRTAIEQYLAENPDVAARIRDHAAHCAALRAAVQGGAPAPIPDRLVHAARSGAASDSRFWLARVAAAVVLLAVGFGGGWMLRQAVESAGPVPVAGSAGVGHLPQLAAAAHRVYSAEVRHPVEVRADEAHLMAWLSKRVGRSLSAPDLNAYGFRLMGGRLLPAASGAAAQLMYEDNAGRRITVYVQGSLPGTESAFRFADENGLSAFYWVDGAMGYALVGPLQRAELLDLAKAVYQQIDM